MSDSVKKWHEMQEEEKQDSLLQSYVETKDEQALRKKAYRILVEYGEREIRLANQILDLEVGLKRNKSV
jgi:hypothetical protein|tara:strand:- start:899 stop:1105 length:207 start_codon:yes stop_codon:yes gene_type:complete